MQLALFVVIVTFAHLSCEVQSESIPVFYEEFKDLPEECQNNLKNQTEQRCHEDSYNPRLVEVSKCEFKCGYENDNGRLKLTTGRTYNLEDGTPCGQNKICIDGKCIPRCSMPFVKGLRGRK
uniref:Putative conserved secreted protein n=1 Tax=Ixodes ricinus TaxID=34613 RepID=A0A6B0UNN4_IXORI